MVSSVCHRVPKEGPAQRSLRWVLVRRVAVVVALTACSSGTDGEAKPTDTGEPTEEIATIAIAGTWVLSNIDVNTGTAPGPDGVTMVIDNDTYQGTYSPSSAVATGDLEEYDNTARFMVIRITRDDRYPESVGVYEKCSWEQPSASSMIMTAYETKATLAEAKATETVVWGPTSPWTKQ